MFITSSILTELERVNCDPDIDGGSNPDPTVSEFHCVVANGMLPHFSSTCLCSPRRTEFMSLTWTIAISAWICEHGCLCFRGLFQQLGLFCDCLS